jgi:hypothetical protein
MEPTSAKNNGANGTNFRQTLPPPLEPTSSELYYHTVPLHYQR